jgi:hypothetical protein
MTEFTHRRAVSFSRGRLLHCRRRSAAPWKPRALQRDLDELNDAVAVAPLELAER